MTIITGLGLLLLTLAAFSLFSMKAPKGSAAMSGMANAAVATFLVEAVHRYISGDLLHLAFLGETGTISGNMGGVAAAIMVPIGMGVNPVFAVVAGVALGGYGILPGFIAGYAIGFIAPFIEKHLPPGLDSVLGALMIAPIARFIAFLVDPAVNAALAHIGGMISAATEQSPILMGLLLGGVIKMICTSPLSSMALTAMLGLTGLPMGIAAIACFGGSFTNGVIFKMLHFGDNMLRDEWGFQGLLVTDYNSIAEMSIHGVAPLKEASVRALQAGTDMDMVSCGFLNTLEESLKEGKVTEAQIDAACRRVLEAKYKLGLFADPYKYCDTLRAEKELYTPEHRAVAREVAAETFVLLKNENHLLPLEEKGKIALIGPMADARNNMCGMWSMTCTPSRHGTLLEGIRSAVGDKAEILYAKGSNVYYDAEMEKGAVGIRPLERGNDQQLLAEALRTAARADVIVAAVGECAEMSGESPSRTNLEIPDAQQDLLKALVKTGKPVVLLLFTGRPLILNWESEHIPSILNVWFGGSETGDAVADVLFGKAVPCGKLTTTFPRSVGQLPLFYNHLNTGRPDPDNRVFNRYASNYLDESNEPLYPFGYGLSYTDFVYGDLQLSSETLPKNGNLTASVTVTNKGNHDGYETVQIYLRDIYAEVARPVKELKGFDRIFLKKGESREVKFVLTEDDLKFYNSGLQYIYEPGEFDVMIGTNSRDVQTKRFIAE